jgi:hypothetical protein
VKLKVIGAGVGRTGTHSLKVALEKLLGEPCYHMVEVFKRPQDVKHWHSAAENKPVNWEDLLEGYAAAVDWPASAFWPELSTAFPDALIILSTRDAEAWWKSAHSTIFRDRGEAPPEMKEWVDMITAMFTNRFTMDLQNKEACIEEFNKHNADVLANAPKNRLLVWTAKDGWEPLCAALGVPVPEESFPLTNTTEEFLQRFKREEPASKT